MHGLRLQTLLRMPWKGKGEINFFTLSFQWCVISGIFAPLPPQAVYFCSQHLFRTFNFQTSFPGIYWGANKVYQWLSFWFLVERLKIKTLPISQTAILYKCFSYLCFLVYLFCGGHFWMIYVDGAVVFLWKLGSRTGMLQSQPIRCEVIARRLHSNFPVH